MQRNKFHYFDKKNSLGSNISCTLKKKEVVSLNNRNTMSQASMKVMKSPSATPKQEFYKAKSRVSLLGQYTSSAITAKNKMGKGSLNKSKQISYPTKLGCSSYQMNTSAGSNSINDYKGQTMDLKLMKDMDKYHLKQPEMNLTMKLATLKHSSTTKCLNDSIGSKMKNCLKGRNSGPSHKGMSAKRKSKVHVISPQAKSPQTSPGKGGPLAGLKTKRSNKIAKLQKLAKKASKEAKILKCSVRNKKIEKTCILTDRSGSHEEGFVSGPSSQNEGNMARHKPYTSFIDCANRKKSNSKEPEEEPESETKFKRKEISEHVISTAKKEKECNLSYNKIVPVFSSRLKTKGSKDSCTNLSTKQKYGKDKKEETFSIWRTSGRVESTSNLQKIDLNISGISKNYTRKFSYGREGVPEIKSLAKVSSEIRNRYEQPDVQEPELEESLIPYSVLSNDSEKEEFIDSDFKNHTQKLTDRLGISNVIKNNLQMDHYFESGSKHCGSGKKNMKIEVNDGFKFSLQPNEETSETPIFNLSHNQENSELRKTARREKIVKYKVFHKSDEETEHYVERNKVEEMLISVQNQDKVKKSEDELEIHLSEEIEEIPIEDSTSEHVAILPGQKLKDRYGVLDSQDSHCNLGEQLSFTNNDGNSNIFMTITDNRKEEGPKESFLRQNYTDDSAQVILETEGKDEFSVGNPLENLTSENEEIKIQSSEKGRCKSKRSETCPTVNQFLQNKNQPKEGRENNSKISYSENKSKEREKRDNSNPTNLDEKSSLVNFDASFMATFTKQDKSDCGDIGKVQEKIQRAVLSMLQDEEFDKLSNEQKAQEIAASVTKYLHS